MPGLNYFLSELRNLKEGGESFCSCERMETSPLKASINATVLCCLFCLTSREAVPVRIDAFLEILMRTKLVESRQVYIILSINATVLCCLFCLTSREAVPVRIDAFLEILMRTKLVESRQVYIILKLASWKIRKCNLFRKIFRFHNSKDSVMNFAKYIVPHIFAKFKYFAKQIIFSNSRQNFQKWA